MKTLLAIILSAIARVWIWRYHPRIVAITGSAGKTSTRTAVAAVLRTRYRVGSAGGNLNDQLGVPASIIIGDFSGWFADHYHRAGLSPLFWMRVLVRGLTGWILPASSYPALLVLEYGADRPGDIRKLTRSFRPFVGVVTQIGAVPVHVEYYASPQHVADEKGQLIRSLGAGGHAVLNHDDLTVLDMKHFTSAQVHTFGVADGATVQVTDLQTRMHDDRPVGLTMNLTTGGVSMPITMRGTLGRGAATAAAAAVTVGRALGIGLAESAEALAGVKPPAGRMRILDGIKGSVLIDDTYNASPTAVHLAIDTVRSLPGRKVLVLGEMRELGAHSVQAHQAVGTMAAEVADELVCVGDGGKFISDAASNQLQTSRVHWFADSREAAPAVQRLVRPGDTVLIKGSQGVRMERIVHELLAEPARAPELLVRQSARWLAK
jgi:UDP-N-acetylmuramoyl-tripeptide--D-alanyl-D-alanine ligase